MRADGWRNVFAGGIPRLFTLAAGMSFLSLGNSSGDGIHHAKFIAQRAAMDALDGPKPFVLREAWWNGRVVPGDAKLIQQQLFKRNTYHFWAAVPDSKSVIFLNIYDGEGRLIESETVRYPEGKNVIGMVISPQATGIYYVRLALSREAKSEQEWALIYAYR